MLCSAKAERCIENPYHYRDARTDGMVEEVIGKVTAERIYDQTGIQFMALNTLYQLYAASRRTPNLLYNAEFLVTMPDLLNFWLTGVVACEYSNASTTQFLDWRTRTWACDLLEQTGYSDAPAGADYRAGHRDRASAYRPGLGARSGFHHA